MKRLFLLIVFLAVCGGGYAWWQMNQAGNGGPAFRTAPVERGNLAATISASGTLQPEEVVDVGAQVAGRIVRFGKDPHDSSKPIDYNTQVEEGTELAFIDEALYRTDYEQAQANLLQAEAQVELGDANVKRAEADLDQLKAKLDQTEREWRRVERLSSRPGAIADIELDIAKANYKSAQSLLGVGAASILQAQASVKDARARVLGTQAARDKAKINRDFCVIKSPVKGVIIERRVNVGQTVVSSLNAPSLFLIAKDLKRMQIWTSVNEADYAQVQVGQKTTFTLDGRPGEIFKGEVVQKRLNATVTQNVVTYTAVISADNSDGKLLAYQTANVTFEIEQRKDVLKVPNAALRWQPRRELVEAEYQDELARLLRRRTAPKQGEKDPAEGVLWRETGSGLVSPIKVKTGLTDGLETEIVAEELKPDDRVVIGIQKVQTATNDDNPLAPKMFGSGNRQKEK